MVSLLASTHSLHIKSICLNSKLVLNENISIYVKSLDHSKTKTTTFLWGTHDNSALVDWLFWVLRRIPVRDWFLFNMRNQDDFPRTSILQSHIAKLSTLVPLPALRQEKYFSLHQFAENDDHEGFFRSSCFHKESIFTLVCMVLFDGRSNDMEVLSKLTMVLIGKSWILISLMMVWWMSISGIQHRQAHSKAF